jgi:hypothetical protein
MRPSLLVRFVILDGVGVGAFLVEDALGGGWAADVLALSLVVGGIAAVVVITARYLRMTDNPTPEEAELDERRAGKRAAARRHGPRRMVHRRA